MLPLIIAFCFWALGVAACASLGKWILVVYLAVTITDMLLMHRIITRRRDHGKD